MRTDLPSQCSSGFNLPISWLPCNPDYWPYLKLWTRNYRCSKGFVYLSSHSCNDIYTYEADKSGPAAYRTSIAVNAAYIGSISFPFQNKVVQISVDIELRTSKTTSFVEPSSWAIIVYSTHCRSLWTMEHVESLTGIADRRAGECHRPNSTTKYDAINKRLNLNQHCHIFLHHVIIYFKWPSMLQLSIDYQCAF